jgi:hypothetical protein
MLVVLYGPVWSSGSSWPLPCYPVLTLKNAGSASGWP